MVYAFEPLAVWPHASTPESQRKSRWAFKAPWSDTIEQLAREVEKASGQGDVYASISTMHRPGDIRRDGLPRTGARTPEHPGVIVQFNGPDGRRLSFACDEYSTWEHNVRAIALTLEALRAVERWGAVRGGAQYAGFVELESPDAVLRRRGQELVIEAGGSVREAKRRTHPDAGGREEDFKAVIAYAETLGE